MKRSFPLNHFSLFAALAAIALPLIGSAQVAPGSITFAPEAATSVPTLGGVMMLVLAGVLAVLGLVALNRRRQHASMMLLAGAVASGAIGFGQPGVQFQHAVAGADCSATISDPAGGTFDVFAADFNEYCNESGLTMTVTELTLPAQSCPDPFATVPTPCELGTDVVTGQSCQIECRSGTPSDRRLKTDIVQVGRTAHDLPLYEFRYLNDTTRYRGVMAQDVLSVRPDAVIRQANGDLWVDYAKLGISPQQLD